MKPLIEIRNLHKSYGELKVFEGVNIKIFPGEFVSFLGPSGCGKTTLLKIIGGLIEPTEGEVFVKEQSVKYALKNHEFGFVFQSPVLFPWRNSIQNIELPLEIIGKQKKSTARELLRIVGLEGFEKSYPNELSGGMQQRIGIARALAFEPSVLLMDEPFGSLDEITRGEMNAELLQIWNEEKEKISAIILVTHSIEEAVFLSYRVIVFSSRPARIMQDIEIDFPEPRKIEIKNSQRFMQISERVRKSL